MPISPILQARKVVLLERAGLADSKVCVLICSTSLAPLWEGLWLRCLSGLVELLGEMR